MRRLYFVLPDVQTSRKVEDDLLLARIDDRHMHFLGKSDMDLKDLPKTGVMQDADAIHGLVFGAVIGGIVGAAAVAATIEFLANDPAMVWTWGLPFPVVGAFIGMRMSSKPSEPHMPHHHAEAFKHALEEGHILLMIDIPVARVDEIRELITDHFPQAEDHGVDPQIPAFP